MRDIKFRAWDKDRQVFHKGNLSNVIIGLDGGILWQFGYGFPEPVFGQFELSQYTGLKDKNGVEIYEGDIVKIGTLDGSPLGAVEWVQKYAEYEIFDNDKYSFGGEYVDDLRAKSFEVVGNIYQNPELLSGDV